MTVIEDLLEHIVIQLKKSGGALPAAQAGALYKSNAEFDAVVTAAGSFKKFIVKHGGDRLEFVDGLKGTEGVKGGCDMVRLKDPGSSTKGPTSPSKDGNLKRKDSSQQKVCKFFKVSFLLVIDGLLSACANQRRARMHIL